ncbi:hypothetical protein OG304_04775 [Streptomyces sp. NBC_00160]|uniref:hypothetical protein n=1 Tax=Streptomyces sp. NBC_00160 TaxID=2903628 RepID=UPI00224EBEBF|nr:hypothetical protein [Streptomyces sp. NBC_00160]MCX5302766.1 hypothetical protein [Streptomyces sp. NBC_00160]
MTDVPDNQPSARPGASGDLHLNVALRSLVDDAEQRVVIDADPRVVRGRAHRRRVRQRAGATALLSLAVVTGGVWGLLPGTRGDAPPVTVPAGPELVSAAMLLPPLEEDGTLTEDALLSPAVLPWNSTYHWRTTNGGDAAAAPLPEPGQGRCEVRWSDALGPSAQVARTYAGKSRAAAQHRIAAFRDTSAASAAAESLSSRLRACGWHETRAPVPQQPHGENLHEYVLTSGAGDPVRVTLVQSDRRVAVLAVSTAVAFNHAHPDSRTDHCLDQSLRDGSTPEHC